MRHDLPDVYDDRPLRGPRPPRTWPGVVAVLVLIAAGAAAWYVFVRSRPAPPPPAPPPVVAVPPKDQAAAMRALRRHLSQPPVRSECIAIIGSGSDGSAYRFNAFNQCENKRLGRFSVNRKTGAISRQ